MQDRHEQLIDELAAARRRIDALENAEGRLGEAVDLLPQTVFEIDLEGNLTFTNRFGLVFTGYTKNDLDHGVNFYHLVVPEDKERVEKNIQRVIRGETPENPSYTIIKKDGTTCPVRLYSSPIVRAGKPSGLRGIVLDITEHKRDESAVRESEEKYRALYNSMADSVFIFDKETTKFLDCNRSALNRYGYSMEEIRRMTPLQLHPPEEMEEVKKNIHSDEGPPHAYTHVAKNGERFQVEIKTDELEFIGRRAWLSIVRDISERKRAEEERRNLEAQIQHAQKLESLGVLAGGIAHDFNNLLTSILGNADLALLKLGAESPSRDSVQQIQTASVRAADLCNQMLAYSGKGRFTVEPLNLNKLIREMTHLLEVSISKSVSLRYDLAVDIPAIKADATQVRQVAMNLITNASDAVGSDGGIITLRTGLVKADRASLADTYLNEDLPEGEYVSLDVSDTGVGMDEKTIARVFEPFFTTKFTGRGLGLAAVLGIVRGHKGAIRLRSELGKGTSFEVLFPALELETDFASEELQEVEFWRSTGTILVVDDEKSVRDTTKRMLEQFGFSVLTAEDGRAGVHVFREHSEEIAVVLLDLTMPHLDGEGALHEILCLEPDAKIIMMSGYDEMEATDRFAGKGLTSFIQKPFRLQKLIDTVRHALERRRGERRTGRDHRKG